MIGDAASIVIQYFDPVGDSSGQYQEYVLSLINNYDKQASRAKLIHNGLQLTIFMGAAAATVLVIVSKVVPAILTGIVTVATAIANYFKFGERGRYAELVAEDLALEYNRFITERGVYGGKPKKEALTLFMDRVESLIIEQRQRSAALEQVKEAQK